MKIFLSYFFVQNSKNLLSRLKSKKIFTIKKVSKFDFKQYRLFKFSKSPILKLSGVLHTFEGGGPISAIGKLPFCQENLPRTMPFQYCRVRSLNPHKYLKIKMYELSSSLPVMRCSTIHHTLLVIVIELLNSQKVEN